MTPTAPTFPPLRAPTAPAVVPPPEPLLDVKGACAALNVSLRTVRGLVADGHLAYVRVGRLVRFRGVDLERFVAANRHGGSGNAR